MNKNPRENIKYDIPKEWIKNFKKGGCPVCAKTKFEFDKGMKVYCSKKCRKEYNKRIYVWQDLRDKILRERKEICKSCGKSKEQLTKEKEDYRKNQRKKFLKEHPEVLEQERKSLMEQAEEYYQRALNLKEEDVHLWQYYNEKELPWHYDSFEVDHIVAIVNGGDQWDEKNLQVLCSTCHKEKTKKDMQLKKKKKE